MLEELTRGARITLFLVALLALPLSVSGQDVSAGGTGQPATQAGGAAPVKRLSVDEAVQMALEQNLSLQVQRVNPRIQDLNTATVRTAWTPTVISSLSSGSTDSPSGNIFSGTGATQTSDSLLWSFGASQLLPTGGNYQVSWGTSRAKTNSLFDNINPRLNSSVSASFTQPLLRNFRIDNTRQQLQISKKNREISDVQLRQAVLGTVRNVKSAYWTLSYSVSSLTVQQQSLDLARESLRNNEARVKIGTMAPIDIIQAQAEVASREEAVIRAQAAVAQAEDQFRALIMDPQTPDFWNMKFELTDTASAQPQAVDVDAAVRRALDVRTDLVQQKKTIEENDISLRYMQNQTKPDVNLNAKYGLSAQGGTLLKYDYSDVLNPVFLGQLGQVGYGSMFKSLLTNDFPQWSFSVTFGYPIGNSSAEANLVRARLQYGQAQTQLRAAELSVVTDVRNAARNVLTNQKRVESTRASRELQEKKLEAEQKKFAAGMQTTFFVLQAQRDLAQARDAELSAILDYTRSLVDFETVQQAPTFGGSSSGVVISPGGQ
jgi:outer membrane protein TolC